MIYWFKRKKDNSYFPIDGERAASSQYWGKQMKNFEYIGRSDGKTYFEMIKQKPMIQKKKVTKTESGADIEGGEVTMVEALPSEHAKLKRQAMLADLEVAKTDKTPPPKIESYVITAKDKQELARDPRFTNAQITNYGQGN